MTKGEAYRTYYLANRERILEANKERNRAYREKLRDAPEAEKVEARVKHRESYVRRKKRDIAEVLLAEAERVDPFWKPFFTRIAGLPHLNKMTDKHLAFLLSVPGTPETLPPS